MTSSSSLNLTLLVQLDGDRAQVADGSQHPITVVVKSQSGAALVTEVINIGADYAAAAALTVSLQL